MRGTARAVAWAFSGTASTRIVTLGSLIILARLLAPQDFGLIAFALVYMTYAETIGDLGTTAALIYWPDRREDAAQVTFAINLVMGLFWCLLTLALAPFIAGFFGNPDAQSIVRVLSFGFLIKFLGNTHDALAQKDLRFRARLVPELGLALTKASLAIALAAAGFGVWSLVWGHLAGLAIWTLAVWIIVRWRPRVTLPRDLFLPMLRYGRGMVGVNMLAAIVHHSDMIIVGRMLGSTALGLYQLAWKIPEATITIIMWAISKVLFPTFSRLRGEDELRQSYLRALTWVSLLTVPVAVVLFVAADPIVSVLFGAKWLDAAPLLRWLAVYAGLRSIGTHAGDVLKATGRSGLLAGLAMVKGALVVPALILAARIDVESVAMTLALMTGVTVLLSIGVVMRLLRFGMIEILKALRTSVYAGTALGLAALTVMRLGGDTLPPPFLLLAIFAAGASTFLGAVFVLDRPLLAEVSRALPFRLSGGSRRDEAPAKQRTSAPASGSSSSGDTP